MQRLSEFLGRKLNASGVEPQEYEIQKLCRRPIPRRHGPDRLILKCGSVALKRRVVLDMVERLSVQVFSNFQSSKAKGRIDRVWLSGELAEAQQALLAVNDDIRTLLPFCFGQY